MVRRKGCYRRPAGMPARGERPFGPAAFAFSPGKEEPLKNVMVVDDERSVVEVVERALDKKGYGHVSFSDPYDALRYFEEHKQDVDVAITNMSMPRMDGPQLAENLRRIRSDICLILITGHGNDQMEQVPPDKLELYDKILYKPFAREELLDAIEEACAA